MLLPEGLRKDVKRLMRPGQRGWLKTLLIGGLAPGGADGLPETPPSGLRRTVVKHRLLFRIRHNTIIDYPRLHRLHDLFEEHLRRFSTGDIVECGVYKGGSAALLAAASVTTGHQGHFWLFDSFRGLPPPGERDRTWIGSRLRTGDLSAQESDVRHLLFERLRLDPARFRIQAGWFHETLPRFAPEIDRVAILHLDCDYYDSVSICLKVLYDHVQDGGLVVIDDYHYFKGCRQAVDEFLDRRAITGALRPTDRFGVYFTKPTTRESL